MRRFASGLLAVLIALVSLAPAVRGRDYPAVLSLKDQARAYDGWLDARLKTLLPDLMRRERIDMWLVICEEYNEDPVYLSLVPFASLSARRLTMLVMFDREGRRASRGSPSIATASAISSRRSGRPTRRASGRPWPRPSKSATPGGSASTSPTSSAFGDGLSASKKRLLVEALGPEYAKRLVPAERLAVGWLERRLPAELEVYDHICAIAHAVIAEAFSNAVITPGVTTTADVEWWIWEKFRALGQTTWFNPGIELQRPASSPYKNSPVIHRGDLLHCDIGINYLRLNTDTQQHAYVLMPGEADAPPGLKSALAQGNRLQDILLAEMKEGLTGNQILAAALKRAKDEGLRPSIYTHPLGVHGHAAGRRSGFGTSRAGSPARATIPSIPTQFSRSSSTSGPRSRNGTIRTFRSRWSRTPPSPSQGLVSWTGARPSSTSSSRDDRT